VKNYKVQNLQSLRDEMKAVSRGEISAPPDAAQPSVNSVEALVRLLTPENRKLLALVRDRKPESVAALAQMSGRSQPNVTRTLNKLRASGFIRMKVTGRKKAPVTAIRKVTIEINPFSESDLMNVDEAG
jgi:predicted transcriptional regulator